MTVQTVALDTPTAARALEYLVAVSYLLLFVPFWRWIDRPVPKTAVARAPLPLRLPARIASWFQVPDGIHFHPGHAWAREEADGSVVVGLDDFAGRLVGPPEAIRLPGAGAGLSQGEKGWALAAAGRSVGMLSPVDGTVEAVNEEALRHPEVVARDPYGAGWLLRVRPTRLGANLKQLVSGEAARRWMDGAEAVLHASASAGLGPVAADGGVPVPGIAREIDPEAWDRIAGQFFLTGE